MRTTSTPSHEPTSCEQAECGFDENALQDLTDTIGAARISQWLVRLDEQLQSTLASGDFADESREQIASTAHAIVSQAALLGFGELAALCSSLEQACRNGADPGHLLGQTRLAAYMARRRIVLLLQNPSDA